MASSGDRAANRRRVGTAVREAAATGAEFVVLPEAVQCSFGAAGSDLSNDAEDLDGPFVTALGEDAAATGVVVVGGMFERSPVAGRVWNTTVVVGPEGLVTCYRKLHLYDALGWRESDQVVAGDPVDGAIVTFALGDLVVGLMTCYDLRFPEMARALVDAGATVLVVPAHWLAGPGKAEVWTTLLRARAIESTAYAVGAAAPGPVCAGHSAVVDPSGEIVASRGARGEGTVTADLLPERVARVRAALPVLEHRRFDVVARPRDRVRPGAGPVAGRGSGGRDSRSPHPGVSGLPADDR
jgi:predicted amidohydrolase